MMLATSYIAVAVGAFFGTLIGAALLWAVGFWR